MINEILQPTLIIILFWLLFGVGRVTVYRSLQLLIGFDHVLLVVPKDDLLFMLQSDCTHIAWIIPIA
jgi:hypothetical protein